MNAYQRATAFITRVAYFLTTAAEEKTFYSVIFDPEVQRELDKLKELLGPSTGSKPRRVGLQYRRHSGKNEFIDPTSVVQVATYDGDSSNPKVMAQWDLSKEIVEIALSTAMRNSDQYFQDFNSDGGSTSVNDWLFNVESFAYTADDDKDHAALNKLDPIKDEMILVIDQINKLLDEKELPKLQEIVSGYTRAFILAYKGQKEQAMTKLLQQAQSRLEYLKNLDNSPKD